MATRTRITSDYVKDVLQADGVKPQSLSPYLAAWRWAESGKNASGLSDSTVRTYEADAARVYRLLRDEYRQLPSHDAP